MTQCVKCNKNGEYHFGAHGEDTWDFSVCKKHMYALWKFLGEKIQLEDEE